MSKKQPNGLLSRYRIVLSVSIVVIVVVLTILIVLSQLLIFNNGIVYLDEMAWAYSKYIENENRLINLSSLQNKNQIVAPTKVFGNYIGMLDCNNVNKLYLLKDNKYQSVKCENIVILQSINPKDYESCLSFSKSNGPKCVPKHIYVPSNYLYCYNDILNKDNEMNCLFEPANISFYLNYDYSSNETYLWKGVAYGAFMRYVNDNNIHFSTTEERDAAFKEYEMTYYCKEIDTSIYNGGYYWVDNLNIGETFKIIPNNPQREGYHFKGWFLDSGCEYRFDLKNYIKDDGDLKVYAGWE